MLNQPENLDFIKMRKFHEAKLHESAKLDWQYSRILIYMISDGKQRKERSKNLQKDLEMRRKFISSDETSMNSKRGSLFN